MSGRIMEAMREQEAGSKHVLDAIHNINDVTEEVSQGSGEMLVGGEDIANQMINTKVATDFVREKNEQLNDQQDDEH